MKKLLFTLLLINYSFAIDKFSIGYGQEFDTASVYSVAIQKEFDYKLIDNTNLSLEISAEFVDDKSGDMGIYSIQPLLSYDFTSKFYVQAGLGVAYFSEKELGKMKFGMNFQFKESLGFGYRFTKNMETILRYTHYSNGDLEKDENAGFDTVLLHLVYRF